MRGAIPINSQEDDIRIAVSEESQGGIYRELRALDCHQVRPSSAET